MENLQATDIAGMAGVAVYLLSYAALQLGFLRGQGYGYASLNAIAAALVLASMVNAFNLSSTIIQVSWIIISVFGIVRYYLLSHNVRLSEEEREFIDRAFPTLEKVYTRKLLNLGAWHSDEPNAVLTEAGLPVPYLIFLLRGSARVLVGGKDVATIPAMSFIGDITAMTGDAATATVVLNERSRYFAIPAQTLRNVLKRDDSLRREVENALAKAVREKLVSSNTARSSTPD